MPFLGKSPNITERVDKNSVFGTIKNDERKFSMENMNFGLIILAGLVSVGILFYILVLLLVQLKIVNRLTETNKQLLIVVAGQNGKAETLRALVASAKPPQGKLKGIANEEKKKSPNTNYTLEVGVH